MRAPQAAAAGPKWRDPSHRSAAPGGLPVPPTLHDVGCLAEHLSRVAGRATSPAAGGSATPIAGVPAPALPGVLPPRAGAAPGAPCLIRRVRACQGGTRSGPRCGGCRHPMGDEWVPSPSGPSGRHCRWRGRPGPSRSRLWAPKAVRRRAGRGVAETHALPRAFERVFFSPTASRAPNRHLHGRPAPPAVDPRSRPPDLLSAMDGGGQCPQPEPQGQPIGEGGQSPPTKATHGGDDATGRRGAVPHLRRRQAGRRRSRSPGPAGRSTTTLASVPARCLSRPTAHAMSGLGVAKPLARPSR